MPKVRCPECSSTNTARIVYGLLEPNDQLEEDIKNNKVHPGGCVISFDDPNRHCNNCEFEFDTPASKRFKESLDALGLPIVRE